MVSTETKDNLAIGSGFLIRGDWGTGKRKTADETLAYLSHKYDHLLILPIDNPEEVTDDVSFIEKIYQLLCDKSRLADTLDTKYIQEFLSEYYRLLQEIKENDEKLLEEYLLSQSYNSLEVQHTQAFKDPAFIPAPLVSRLKSQFDRINDQRIILDKRKLLFTAFINDLIDAVFPQDNDFPTLDVYQKKLDKETLPVKIVLDISRCDTILGGVNSMLLDIICELNKSMTLKDLERPSLHPEPEKAKLSKFFQFIPLISTTSPKRAEDNRLQEIAKEYYKREKVKALVEDLGLDSDTTLDRVWYLYNGHPLLTDWHLSLLNEGRKEKDFIDELQQFTHLAFNHLAEQKKYLVFALAVFGHADARILSIVTGERGTYWYDLLSHFYFVNKDNERLSLKKPFRLLASYLPFDNEATEFLEHIIELYLGLESDLQRFPDEDLELLRKIAVFDRFTVSAIRDYEADGDKPYQGVDELIEVYPDIFLKNGQTISIEPRIRNTFLKFNTLKQDEDLLISYSSKLWETYAKGLESMLLQTERDRKLRSSELKQLEDKEQKYVQQQNKITGDLKKIESDLQKAVSNLGQFAEKKNDKLASVFLIIAITAIILYMISNWFFSNFFEHDETIAFASWILLIISIICFMLSSKLIYRLIVGYMQKNEIEKKRSIRSKLENDLLHKKQQLQQVSADLKATQDKKHELGKDLANTAKEYETIQELKKEPFLEK